MNLKLKTFVCLILLTASLLASNANAQTASQSPVKPSSMAPEPVVLHVTVTDKSGSFVAGLKSGVFEVTIDKKPAQIASLNLDDSPVSVGILLDTSRSTGIGSGKQTSKDRDALQAALRHLLESGNQANDYFLIGFNTTPQLLADWTSDPATIIAGSDRLVPYGNTALYDACYLAVDKLSAGRHEKRALVLISDGLDNQSHYTFIELRDRLRESNVLLYSIRFPKPNFSNSALDLEGAGILDELSFISGGKSFADKGGADLRPKDAYAVFDIIATELRHQYTLSIVPTETLASKKLHKIKVKVNLPRGAPQVKGLSVRSREGIYVP